jgi:hypothetical protein
LLNCNKAKDIFRAVATARSLTRCTNRGSVSKIHQERGNNFDLNPDAITEIIGKTRSPYRDARIE